MEWDGPGAQQAELMKEETELEKGAHCPQRCRRVTPNLKKSPSHEQDKKNKYIPRPIKMQKQNIK